MLPLESVRTIAALTLFALLIVPKAKLTLLALEPERLTLLVTPSIVTAILVRVALPPAVKDVKLKLKLELF